MASQYDLAKYLGINQSQVCRNLGKRIRSVEFCRVVEAKTGLPWKDVQDMPPADLRAALESAYAAARPKEMEAANG